MNAKNTPAVAKILREYKLDYIPEVHTYLKTGDTIIDCTKANSKPEDFINDLVVEIEITPPQIADFKVAYHKAILQQCILEQNLNITLDALWAIREKCIANF